MFNTYIQVFISFVFLKNLESQGGKIRNAKSVKLSTYKVMFYIGSLQEKLYLMSNTFVTKIRNVLYVQRSYRLHTQGSNLQPPEKNPSKLPRHGVVYLRLRTRQELMGPEIESSLF
jgi:hypothetical protein